MSSPDTPSVVFGLKRCDTCSRARKWLDSQGIAYEFVDYRDEPVNAATLRQWAASLQGWDKLVNRSSTTWRQLPEEQKQPADDEAWLALVQANPTLVKRPVLVTPDGVVSVGFKEPAWKDRYAR